ncbi:probable tRNA (uracil-O(2)-)-methyltransferase [Astyanax mexicanus]|uniref:probable tRNA (uracil-O(2)-)-methyltransferase n=1 Tax=Astyanax mexicanus TaxID=7994 RepID=UPI0020CAAAE9|nr:probable tRNA (uracil-O(2)-)-methyltransferase [Astyanax mexicanus]
MSKLFEIRPEVRCSATGFWSACEVWIQKPHVVNKRLCGVKEGRYEEAVNTEGLQRSLALLLTRTPAQDLTQLLQFIHRSAAESEQQSWSVGVRTIIPKVASNSSGANLCREIIVKDFIRQAVTFLPIEENSEGPVILKKSNIYQIQFEEESGDCVLSLHALNPDQWYSDGVTYPKLSWLEAELLPKLARWATDNKSSEFKSTLSLIPVEKYSILYQELKTKYKDIVKVWPEVTDPEKFVFEDVAIATYLLVLWEEERAKKGLTSKQSFVDLGCGNGLLVHILNNEGHPGKGIDVRKRKIWDMYGPDTHLEEKAITPSASFLFPETDWLIGNHSDELTPWIPVIAARSSYSCRYFVLPCCFFDFFGKYQRRQCKKSQYREYIDFISDVSGVCGFQTDEDCLRIPSTKRVCLIGRSRSYKEPEGAEADVRRADYIRGRQVSSSSSSDVTQKDHSRHNHHEDGQEIPAAGSDWGSGFQPREKIETVRNCAALPRDLIDAVVLKVARALLGLTAEAGEEENRSSLKDTNKWNTGGSLSIREVAELLDHSTLQTLKKECGGLQTLLKNSHQVFRVEGGRVHIRDWRTSAAGQRTRVNLKNKSQISGALKTRECWFHTHHPNGCPLSTEDCLFAHGVDDLRPSTRPLKKFKH